MKVKIQAFTLIELLVSISIIAMMAALSISAYPKFSAQLATVSETYRLLSYLKETQSYGVSSFTNIGEKLVYGVEINSLNNTIKRVSVNEVSEVSLDSFQRKFTNTSFVNNKTYLNSPLDIFTLKSGYKIVSICKDIECQTKYITGYTVYKRPNPEARIFALEGIADSYIIDPSVSALKDASSLDKLIIVVSSIKDVNIQKKIVILSTGQMYIQN